jgi:DNA-binding beta-propeller fold protein YncE
MRWAVGLVLFLAGGIVSAQPLSKPQGVAFTPSGTRLAISDTGNNRVLIFALKGNRWHLQAIIAKLNEPHGLAWIDDERLLVCEAGKGSVSAFRIIGNDVKRLFVLNGFKRPLGLTVWRNLIFVTDAEAKKVIVLDSNGRKLSEFGGNHPSGVNAPCDVSVASDGTIFVADDDGDVEIWRFELESFRAQPKEPFSLKGFWTCKSVAVVGSELWALSSYSGELKRANLSDLTKPNWRIFTGFLDGTEREVIAAHSGHRTPDGKLSRNSIFAAGKVPKVLALGRLGTPISPASDFDVAPKTGWLAIATGNRVLILPASLNLPTRPQINATQTEATVCWETPEPSETIAEFRPADSSQWQRVSLPGRRAYHRLLLRGLTPATSYRFRI